MFLPLNNYYSCPLLCMPSQAPRHSNSNKRPREIIQATIVSYRLKWHHHRRSNHEWDYSGLMCSYATGFRWYNSLTYSLPIPDVAAGFLARGCACTMRPLVDPSVERAPRAHLDFQCTVQKYQAAERRRNMRVHIYSLATSNPYILSLHAAGTATVPSII